MNKPIQGFIFENPGSKCCFFFTTRPHPCPQVELVVWAQLAPSTEGEVEEIPSFSPCPSPTAHRIQHSIQVASQSCPVCRLTPSISSSVTFRDTTCHCRNSAVYHCYCRSSHTALRRRVNPQILIV